MGQNIFARTSLNLEGEAYFLPYGPFALTGRMVQIRHTGWQKNVPSSTGTSKTKESRA